MNSKKRAKKNRKTQLAALKMKVQIYKLIINNFTEEDFSCPQWIQVFGKWYKVLARNRHQ